MSVLLERNLSHKVKVFAKGVETTMARCVITVALTCVKIVNAQLTDESGASNSAALSTVALSTTSALSTVAAVGMDTGWQIYTGVGSAAMYATDMGLAARIAGALRSKADTTGSVYIRHRDRSNSVDGCILGWGVMAPAESLREAVYACLTSHQPHDRDLLGSVWMWVSTEREWRWLCRPYVVMDSHTDPVIDEIRRHMPSRTRTEILRILKRKVFKRPNKDVIRELEEGHDTGMSASKTPAVSTAGFGLGDGQDAPENTATSEPKEIVDAAKLSLADRKEGSVIHGLRQMRRSITDGFPERKDIKVRVVKEPLLVTTGVKAFDVYCLYEHRNRMATCLSLISVLPMLGLLVALYGVNAIAANLALTAVIDYVACGKAERAENYARAGGYLHCWAKTELAPTAQRSGEDAGNQQSGSHTVKEKLTETTTRRMCKQAAYPGENAARFVLAQLPTMGNERAGLQTRVGSYVISRCFIVARIVSFLIICGMPLVYAFLVKNWKEEAPRPANDLFFYPILAIGITLTSIGQVVALYGNKEPLVVREVTCGFDEYVHAWLKPQSGERNTEWRVIDKGHLAERFLDANVFGSVEDAMSVTLEFIRPESSSGNENNERTGIASSVSNATPAFIVACVLVTKLMAISH